MSTMTLSEWRSEGKRRFGASWKSWKFQCPHCKNIATPKDFARLGADETLAYQECIGRSLPKEQRASNFGATPAANGAVAPCDYAAYGLFRTGHEVMTDSGTRVQVIPFAGPDTQEKPNHE